MIPTRLQSDRTATVRLRLRYDCVVTAQIAINWNAFAIRLQSGCAAMLKKKKKTATKGVISRTLASLRAPPRPGGYIYRRRSTFRREIASSGPSPIHYKAKIWYLSTLQRSLPRDCLTLEQHAEDVHESSIRCEAAEEQLSGERRELQSCAACIEYPARHHDAYAIQSEKLKQQQK
jgi:hypothetical protein